MRHFDCIFGRGTCVADYRWTVRCWDGEFQEVPDLLMDPVPIVAAFDHSYGAMGWLVTHGCDPIDAVRLIDASVVGEYIQL